MQKWINRSQRRGIRIQVYFLSFQLLIPILNTIRIHDDHSQAWYIFTRLHPNSNRRRIKIFLLSDIPIPSFVFLPRNFIKISSSIYPKKFISIYSSLFTYRVSSCTIHLSISYLWNFHRFLLNITKLIFPLDIANDKYG